MIIQGWTRNFFMVEKDLVQLNWNETLVHDYTAVPPTYVAEKLTQAKSVLPTLFDYYTVAELNTRNSKIKDPLLLGRIKDVNIRFFICQWDDDIQLDDII